MGDWDALRTLIDHNLADDYDRSAVADVTTDETVRRHTYTVRMAQVLESVCPSLLTWPQPCTVCGERITGRVLKDDAVDMFAHPQCVDE